MAKLGSSRTVSLTPELDAIVTRHLASGAYGSANEVIDAALRTLQDIEQHVPSTNPWPIGGGECGRLIRETDWNHTPLGPVDRWSPALRAGVDQVVNAALPSVLMWGPDHVLFYNDGYRAIAGDRHPGALGRTVAEVWPENWDRNRTLIEDARSGEIVSCRGLAMTIYRSVPPQDVVLDLFYTRLHEEDGSVGGILCAVIENTDRVRMERALADREAQLHAITDALPVLISSVDRDMIYRFANAHYEKWIGSRASDMIGKHVRDVIGPALFAEREPLIRRALAGERVVADAQMPHRDGGNRLAEVQYLPQIEADGSVSGFHVLVFDVEDRLRHAQSLEASNRRFRAAMDAIHGVLWTNSADGRMLGEQPGWAALTGQSADEYRDYGWTAAVHPDDVAGTVEAWHAALAAKAPFIFEHRVCRHDGVWRDCAIRALPIIDSGGDIVEWVGVHTDITHQRAAERALHQLNETLEARIITEIAERRQAETALAQAQKMETIGKLTGGVAHDFNNLLQVVSGNLQLLARDVADRPRAEKRITNAMAGVARGSKLAAQLLAFGRRQALEPKVINITRLVRDMDDMLRRAIGEGIEIETVVAGGLWNTFIDPAQIENALLNLAINARDAMEGVGRLTIELGNAHLDDAYARTHDEVAPGQYVMLAVSDTGSGMAPEIIDKVFEPFFSTKSEGKGSGLGLSMVYGFVKQSGGHVKIYSEVGEGTTIRLYLPRAMASEDVEVASDPRPATGGTETVLVVEDDDAVRDTVVEMLGELGYRVLKAVDAQSALTVIESGVGIDLLFTDVVMPGQLKSPEMARRARARLPDLAVLFTSGYTENSIVHGGRLDAVVELLSKPYTREALARKIAHVLANQRQRRGRGEPAIAPSPVAEPSARPTILLVEDDALIRASTAEVLQHAGYVVVDAGSAEDAMTALQTAPVDILVTDINLPGTSGVDLADVACGIRPGIGIVFATGDQTLVRSDTATRTVVLAKPYDAAALYAAIESLGATPPIMTTTTTAERIGQD